MRENNKGRRVMRHRYIKMLVSPATKHYIWIGTMKERDGELYFKIPELGGCTGEVWRALGIEIQSRFCEIESFDRLPDSFGPFVTLGEVTWHVKEQAESNNEEE